MSYFTPEGLQQVALAESSNNPTAVNPSNLSSTGLYGFINSTWTTYANMYSPGLSSIYPTAADAPPAVQTAVAQITPTSNWTCPGCDATISAAVQSDPSLLSSTPVTDTSTGGILNSLNPFSAASIAADPYNPGGTGTGSQSPLGSLNPSSWFQTAFTYLGNILARGGLMLLAVVMIAIGLIFVLKDTSAGQAIGGAAKKVVAHG
jgi:hypothetical protein